jgi:hypothetical protein|eukprot:COSAG06_NODE_2694_length_6440_cov_1.995584_8_plen_220_part_00
MVPLLQPVTVLHLRATDRRIVNRVKAGGGGYSWARQMCEHRQRQAGGGGGARHALAIAHHWAAFAPSSVTLQPTVAFVRTAVAPLAAASATREPRNIRGVSPGSSAPPWRLATPASAAKRSTWLPPPKSSLRSTTPTVIGAAAVEAERRRQAVCAQVAGTHQPHGQALLCADVLFFRPPHRNARGADALDAHLRGSGVRRAARLSALRPSGRRSGRCRR